MATPTKDIKTELTQMGRKRDVQTALEKIKLAESFVGKEKAPASQPANDWFVAIKGQSAVCASNRHQ